MTLNSKDRDILRNAGFTEREITEINNAKDRKGNPITVDLTRPSWKDAIANRDRWTKRVRRDYEVIHGRPLEKGRFEQIVNRFYQMGKRRNPFDWLKLTYQPRKQTDFLTATKKRIIAQQKELRTKGFGIGAEG